MKTLEFTEYASSDGVVRLNIPVEPRTTPYHVVVHIEPAATPSSPEYLTDEFVNETAGKWVGDFTLESEGDYEKRESL